MAFNGQKSEWTKVESYVKNGTEFTKYVTGKTKGSQKPIELMQDIPKIGLSPKLYSDVNLINEWVMRNFDKIAKDYIHIINLYEVKSYALRYINFPSYFNYDFYYMLVQSRYSEPDDTITLYEFDKEFQLTAMFVVKIYNTHSIETKFEMKYNNKSFIGKNIKDFVENEFARVFREMHSQKKYKFLMPEKDFKKAYSMHIIKGELQNAAHNFNIATNESEKEKYRDEYQRLNRIDDYGLLL